MAPNKSGVNKFTRFELPSVLSSKYNSEFMVEAPGTANHSTIGRRPALESPVLAAFIIPGEDDVVAGMVQLVHDDLRFANGASINMEFKEEIPHIRFKARTEEDVLALVRGAQELGSKNLAGCPPELHFKFVEPPAGYMAEKLQIVIQTRKDESDKNEDGKDILVPDISVKFIPGAADLPGESASDEYERKVAQCIYEALQESATVHTRLAMKVYLGHYVMTTWKIGKYTLDEYEKTIRLPRAEGKFHTDLGKTPSGRELGVEAAMRLIQANDSPCVPIDNQTATTADVVPTYVFESWHQGDRYETELDKIKVADKRSPTSGSQNFALGRTRMISRDAQLPRFEALSIGVGVSRKLDWKITATLGNEKAHVAPAVKRYLEAGEAVMQGSSRNFHSYPAIRLPENPALATKLKSVAIKSIYQFNWKDTGYMVQVTINRRWNTIRDMNRSPPQEADFDIMIHADVWDQDDCGQDEWGQDEWGQDDPVQEAWGTGGKSGEGDLEGHLGDDKAGAEMGGKLGKARGLLKTIQDIRGFFESLDEI